jgi:hypothetical protein
MRRSFICCAGLVALAAVCSSVRARAEVNIGINIGVPPPAVVVAPVPPPAVVVAGPPQLVVVPTTPAVRYAPGLHVNLFFYDRSYYTFHEGAWFVAPTYGGPWVYVERAPRALRIVPARFYKIPPGHMKRIHGHRRGKHHHRHDRDDRHGRRHGHGKHDD